MMSNTIQIQLERIVDLPGFCGGCVVTLRWVSRLGVDRSSASQRWLENSRSCCCGEGCRGCISGPTRRWRARAVSMSSQGPWLRISSALYSELSASARAKPKGVPLRPHRGDRLGLGQGLPVANRPVLHPTVASDAPGPSGPPRFAFVARRPSPGRLGPGRCTLAGRWSASR